MTAEKVNDRGSQPRNRELKGKPLGWPKDRSSNFKWVLPKMPGGYPMRNPRILRLISTNLHTFSGTPVSGECEEKQMKNCVEEYAHRFHPPRYPPGICSDTPVDLGSYTRLETLDQFMRSGGDCSEIGVLRAGDDGGVFKLQTVTTTIAEPERPDCEASFITGSDAVGEIAALYSDIYFVDRIHVNNVNEIKDLILPSGEVTEQEGLYGPKVLNIVFIQDIGGSDWQQAYAWYVEQRKPPDRWIKYTTYFNLDFSAEYYRLSHLPGTDFSDVLAAARRDNSGIYPPPDVTDFDSTGPLLYSKSYIDCANSVYGAELEYVVDFYRKEIDKWFAEP